MLELDYRWKTQAAVLALRNLALGFRSGYEQVRPCVVPLENPSERFLSAFFVKTLEISQ
jgi:hypothetical protein